jgi:serine/threonine-protein kinase
MDTLGFDQVPARASATGLTLGDTYVVGRRLARGAMGEVYEAEHVRLPGRFAVKLLLRELQGNQDAFARFCREAEIMSQLRHPHIVQIYDFNVAPDARPYFVMEYLQGRDLEARLKNGPLPLPAVTRIVDAVASALAVAHAHGVVHRDLKPANIFLATVDGQTDELVKVLDFGISKVRAAAAQISQAVDLLGTPAYMSPEQARGQTDQIDGRTDQFALAAITYRMLTSQDPFHGDDTAAVLYQVVHEDPPPLSLFLPPGWDTSALQAVLDRALAKQPDRRFGGMMELARAFDDAAERTLGPGTDAAGDLPLAAAARAARGRPIRLDDAHIDTPPPVRRPTPLVLKPIRRLPTPAPTPTPAAAPVTPVVRQMDWEVRNDVDEVPRTHTRGALLALFALAVIGLFIITGWYRKLPGAADGARARIHEWTRPPGAAPETRAEPPPASSDQAAPPEAPERSSREETPPAAPPAAAPAAAPSTAAPAAPGSAPSAEAAPPAAATPRPRPRKPRAPAHHATRPIDPHAAVRSFTPPPPTTPFPTTPASPDQTFAPPPPTAFPTTPASPDQTSAPPPSASGSAVPGSPTAPAPASPTPVPGAAPAPPVQVTPPADPPVNGRAFEIAPPNTSDRGRDLAPPAEGTSP